MSKRFLTEKPGNSVSFLTMSASDIAEKEEGGPEGPPVSLIRLTLYVPPGFCLRPDPRSGHARAPRVSPRISGGNLRSGIERIAMQSAESRHVSILGATPVSRPEISFNYTRSSRRRCCTSCRCRCAPACSCRIRRKPRPHSPASWPWLLRPYSQRQLSERPTRPVL